MNVRALYYFIPLLLFLCLSGRVQAQPRQADQAAQKDKPKTSMKKSGWLDDSEQHIHEFSILGGYAFNSFELWGKTPNATIGQLGFGYNRKFYRFGEQLIEYRLEFNAFSKVTYPNFSPETQRSSLSGFGLSPLGLRLNFRESQTVQPFLGTAVGFLYLDGPFPDERGKKFNYTFRTGAGIEFLINRGSSISIGYTYMHLSNGDSGEINPGIDSGFIFASLTFF